MDFLAAHQKAVWTLFLICLVLAATGVPRLQISPDNRVFYGDESVHYAQLLEFESEFGPTSNMAFVVSCDASLDSCPALARTVRDLTDTASQIEGVYRVDSLATYPLVASTDTTISTTPVLDYLCQSNCDLSKIENLQTAHLIGRFTNEDFSTLAVIARLNLDIEDPASVERIYEQGTTLLSNLPSELQGHFVGTVPLMNAFLRATYNELTGVMGIAGVLILIALFLTLGSSGLTVIVSCLGLGTIVITLGIAGWTGLVLNTATATIPLVLFTLVVASSMHFFMAIVRTTTDDSRSHLREAVAAALATQSKPILFTALTTIVCMLSLVSVSSPPVQDIGIWTAVGITVGTALLLVVAPLSILILGRIPKSKWHTVIQPVLNKQARRLERSVTKSLIISVAVALSLASILLLDIDDDFLRFFDSSNSFRVSSEWVSNELSGPNNVEVIVDSGTTDGVFETSHIDHLLFLAERLRSRPEISNVYSLLDVLTPLNRHLNMEKSLTEVTKEELAQLFLAYELSLEYGQSSRDLVSFDRSSSRISLVVEDISAKEIRELETYILRLRDSRPELGLVVTGESIPISHLSPDNISAMAASIALAFIMTAGALAAYFGQWKIAVIAIVSTVVPVLAGFGIWGLFHDSIGLASTVIVAVCMGVVIDDTIHMIYSHFDASNRLGLDGRHAAAYAVHRVGSAMLTTTIVLGLGFTVLLLSDFRLNSAFGGCSALILACALAFDLRILPEMLVWATDNRPQN